MAELTANLHITPDIMSKLLKSVCEVFRFVKDMWNELARIIVPPKWWHFYKHSKKARVRKKYQDKIMRAIAAYLAARKNMTGS